MPKDEEAPIPSMSFVADSHDLVRFFRVFLSSEVKNAPPLLHRDTILTMLSPQAPAIEKNQGTAVGLPWLLDPGELTFLGHVAWYAGKYYGHRTCVILAPELGIGALAVTNSWAWDAKTLLYELCSSLLTRYATKELGIQAQPKDEEDQQIPEVIRNWLDGSYASELGRVTLRVQGQTLKADFEGIDSELSYKGASGFVATGGGGILGIRPAGIESIDIEFASGVLSPLSPKLARPAYPPAWKLQTGVYKRSGGDKSLPYAIEILSNDDLFSIRGGDGREYILLPQEDGSARIVCGAATSFSGKKLRFTGEGTAIMGESPYLKIR